MWETWVQSLGWEEPLEKGKATRSSILVYRIPWTVKPTGLQRVGHDWVAFTFIGKHFLHYKPVNTHTYNWNRFHRTIYLSMEQHTLVFFYCILFHFLKIAGEEGDTRNWFHVPLMSSNSLLNSGPGFKSTIFLHYFGSTVFQEFREIIESVDFKLFNWIDCYCHIKEIDGNYKDLEMLLYFPRVPLIPGFSLTL